ncbi:RdgB/HAM1 family non-canonical purine NTP pyrophosphatase [Saxibacter everestensis]|uniref:dITP/XTP pyrophosphatase n=1 Tax=Saxibacter everestensis TaxID=2909229 RepID=A0ABY8QPA3_9MICO|nr:RdgB/HAM1 family non-canonical purine NTP pyrophosphatase [Brevibacteriaceae bacterium ZFBP1038]
MNALLVLATHNQNKVRELRAILREAMPDLDVEAALVSAADLGVDEVRETGVTFAENALLKARALAAGTGLPAIADDSGLAVDVLGGAPGIFSARWAGKHGDDVANLKLLLAQLADIPAEHRSARFVCAAALATPDGRTHVEHGSFEGVLADAPRGTNGFGYDPILSVNGDPRGRTAAELEPAEKNALSHRGKAFRALAPVVRQLLAEQPGR